MVDWERRSKIHQNSIHSLSAHQLGDNSWLLVTGGDDNGLGLSRLHIGEAAPAPEVNFSFRRAIFQDQC